MTRPSWIPWIDRLSVGLFVLAWTAVGVRSGPALFEPEVCVAVLLGVLLGYVLADFVSGCVHWLADRHFDPTTPLLGPLLIEPFREHHRDPLGITRHDLFDVTGNNGLVTLPLALGLLALPIPVGASAAFFSSTFTMLGLASCATNLFHRWAHMAEPPAWVRPLQACGFILSPRHHARHHRGDYDQAYCVTSGWLNPLLDRSGFFLALDRIGELAQRVFRSPAATAPVEVPRVTRSRSEKSPSSRSPTAPDRIQQESV